MDGIDTICVNHPEFFGRDEEGEKSGSELPRLVQLHGLINKRLKMALNTLSKRQKMRFVFFGV